MKNLLILLVFLAVPAQAQLLKTMKDFKGAYLDSSLPHEGMSNPLKLNLKSSIESLMDEHECYLHLNRPIVIQKNEIMATAGSFVVLAEKKDRTQRRVLPKGTHIRLHSIHHIPYNDSVRYGNEINIFDTFILIQDSAIGVVYVENFWEWQIQEYNAFDVFLGSLGALTLECAPGESKVVR